MHERVHSEVIVTRCGPSPMYPRASKERIRSQKTGHDRTGSLRFLCNSFRSADSTLKRYNSPAAGRIYPCKLAVRLGRKQRVFSPQRGRGVFSCSRLVLHRRCWRRRHDGGVHARLVRLRVGVGVRTFASTWGILFHHKEKETGSPIASLILSLA